MSELKAKHVVDVYDEYSSNPYNEAQVYLKSDVDKAIADKDAKILALDAEVFKQKHHAKLFFDERNYAEAELRKTQRAMWLARAERARSSALSYHLIESHPDKDAAATYKRKANKWEKVKDKCIKKAEEYK